jgi:hypothetical protein
MAFLGFMVCGFIGSAFEWIEPTGTEKKSEGIHKLNTTARMGATALAADPIVFVASLVIGLLGLFSVIHGMPPAASYALIGYAGFTFLTWIINAACSPARGLAYRLTRAAFSNHPQTYLDPVT